MKRSYFANIKFVTTEGDRDKIHEYEDIYNFGEYHFEADDERYITTDLTEIASSGESIEVIEIEIKRIPEDEIEKAKKDLLDKWNAEFEARRKELGYV